jgi:hypothetical protein
LEDLANEFQYLKNNKVFRRIFIEWDKNRTNS